MYHLYTTHILFDVFDKNNFFITLLFTASKILARLDRTVDPCDNFYQFACGGWLKNNLANISYPRISSLSVISEETMEQIKGAKYRFITNIVKNTYIDDITLNRYFY